MKNTAIVAVVALSAVLVAPAAFAQQASSPNANPPASTSQQTANSEVVGTIVTLTTDRIDVKVDSITASQGAANGSTVMVGKTTAFALDSSSQLPQGLKAGDKVDLWFSNDNGTLRATRVALAVGGDQPADTSGAATEAPAPDVNSSSASEQASGTSPEPSGQSAMNSTPSSSDQASPAAQSANSSAAEQGAHRATLPKTGSPMPLIGLIGLVALASVLALRFVVRA